MKKRPKIYWYARTNEIKCMGPYKSEIEAWNSLRGFDGFPVKDAVVWCTTDTYK
jgi:hypothetical protein